ncbi:uncharacterized protein METZ01_LOCUS441710 [marine metagenome]|uniref:Transcription elongation factor GreA n=1 Tax=marine metagenome TaxID=408172 RepID=A0A382Z054_9ZZZZ
MNKENTTYLTKNGLSELEAELQHLVSVRRAEVADRLHQAQEDGDLLENAEYEAAKNEQSFVEGRIADIQTMLSKVTVIKKGKVDGVAKLGSTVMVQENDLAVETYVIVGAAEANPAAGLISNESPLGQELLGSKAGDKVAVDAPGGDLIFLVTKIK